MGLFSFTKYEVYDGKRPKNAMEVRYLKISKRVIGIDDQTFTDFKNLGDVIIPDSVEFIGKEAFKRCEGLLELKMPDSILSVGIAAFENCLSLRQVKLSDQLAGLSEDMFANCGLLSKILIPKSVRQIGKNAFSGCTSLDKIVFESEIPPIIYDGMLDGVSKDCRIYVPERNVDTYRAAWHNIELYIRPTTKDILKDVTIK